MLALLGLNATFRSGDCDNELCFAIVIAWPFYAQLNISALL
jgi:hypothetical protein